MTTPFKLKYKNSGFPFKTDKEEIGDTIIYPPGDDKWEVKGYSKEIIDAIRKGGGKHNYKNTKEYKKWLEQQKNIDKSV